MAMLFRNEPVPRDPRRIKATRRRANISAGPNFMARLASVGASSITPRTLSVPPTQDPQAAMKRAAPALPFLVIW